MAVAHYLSMVTISVLSFIIGILPIKFKFLTERFCSLFLSLILCLGAGVLLATSLIHMLSEVQEKLKFFAQLYFCAGFLGLYFFDEISHYFLNKRNQETSFQNSNSNLSPTSSSRVTYNAISTENTPLLSSNNSILRKSTDGSSLERHAHHSDFSCSNKLSSHKRIDESNPLETCSHTKSSCAEQVHCHIEIGKPCSSNSIAKGGLLIALTVHSVFEGVSIGIQSKFNEIFLMLGSVTLHKVVLSFCLGLELQSANPKKIFFILAIFLFSIGSSLGIAIGMLVTNFKADFNIDANINAVAAGSLLYVAAFEVLPRERFQWQHKKQRAAGLLQFFFVLLGFTCLSLLHFFVVSPYDHNSNFSESAKNFTIKTSV